MLDEQEWYEWKYYSWRKVCYGNYKRWVKLRELDSTLFREPPSSLLGRGPFRTREEAAMLAQRLNEGDPSALVEWETLGAANYYIGNLPLRDFMLFLLRNPVSYILMAPMLIILAIGTFFVGFYALLILPMLLLVGILFVKLEPLLKARPGIGDFWFSWRGWSGNGGYFWLVLGLVSPGFFGLSIESGQGWLVCLGFGLMWLSAKVIGEGLAYPLGAAVMYFVGKNTGSESPGLFLWLYPFLLLPWLHYKSEETTRPSTYAEREGYLRFKETLILGRLDIDLQEEYILKKTTDPLYMKPGTERRIAESLSAHNISDVPAAIDFSIEYRLELLTQLDEQQDVRNRAKRQSRNN